MSHARSIPTGTVTFLFTDLEGSTRPLTELREGSDEVLAARLALAPRGDRATWWHRGQHRGRLVLRGLRIGPRGKPRRWRRPNDRWQRNAGLTAPMSESAWDSTPEKGVWEARTTWQLDVNHAARVSAAGHGGQTLLSQTTAALVMAAPPSGVTLRNLGRHRLKDLPAPEHLWQLVIEGQPDQFPPVRTLQAPGAHLPTELTSFVSRAELEAVVSRGRPAWPGLADIDAWPGPGDPPHPRFTGPGRGGDGGGGTEATRGASRWMRPGVPRQTAATRRSEIVRATSSMQNQWRYHWRRVLGGRVGCRRPHSCPGDAHPGPA